MLTTTNYTNRAIDLNITTFSSTDTLSGTSEQKYTFIPASGTTVCAGVIKLATMLIKTLFTNTGMYDTSPKSSFPDVVKSVRSIRDAYVHITGLFHIEAPRAVEQVLKNIGRDSPILWQDELPSSWTLEDSSVDYALGVITLKTRVTTVLGSSVTVVLPIKKVV